MCRSLALFSVLAAILFVPEAYAEPDPERQWQNYGRKIAHQCGVDLKLDWNIESLKKHVLTIKRGQTDGARWCNEPLRYLWYACKSAEGKKKVQKAKIRKLSCEGSPDPKKGSLSVRKGVITVRVGDDESKAYLRSAKQFQNELKLKLKLDEADPYRDYAWDALRNKPNPVTDKRNYCVVNGKKFDFEVGGFEDLDDELNGKNGSVKCWRNGKPYTDIRQVDGKKSGFDTYMYLDRNKKLKDRRVSNFRDGQKHGYQSRETEGGLANESFYDRGTEVWSKEYHFSSGKYGALRAYTHSIRGKYATRAVARYNQDGSLRSIRCEPGAGSDPVFRKLCGFDGAVVTRTYKKKGVARQEYKFMNGLLEGAQSKERNGLKSTVKYRSGKKHGVEEFVNKDGDTKLAISWKDGVRDGTTTQYDEKENKVVKVESWKAGTLKNETLYYLNNQKRRTTDFHPPKTRTIVEYHDNGNVSDKGSFVVCKRRYWSNYCRDGKHTSYYENGKTWSVRVFASGKHIGTHKGYHENGQVAAIAVFKDDVLSELQMFDETGKKTLDEKYEADGSRK